MLLVIQRGNKNQSVNINIKLDVLLLDSEQGYPERKVTSVVNKYVKASDVKGMIATYFQSASSFTSFVR